MHDLSEYVQYRCIVGSRAYGLADQGSDTDLRGFYLPPARLHWSLRKLPEQLENVERQECFWELEKLLKLALESNPNVLECLNTPLIQHVSPLASDLLAMRSAFHSKLAYAKYSRYAEQQFGRLSAAREKGDPTNWKHAMHMLRLMIAGTHLLRYGEVLVDVSEFRERLLEVKRGKVSWGEVEAWRSALQSQLDSAYMFTELPEKPDREAVDAFLIGARMSMADA
ncbi:MAG TPA: nucleotidyltransferase domain-containing protein [Fimbriimonas sp.]|nr:nucleotidyltransferase domain-containing protein [Fimbriimonas sp.]